MKGHLKMICLLAALLAQGVLRAGAQESVSYSYQVLTDWHLSGDTVCYVGYHWYVGFLREGDADGRDTVVINGRVYDKAFQSEVSPVMSRRAATETGEHRESVGVRYEDGRVLCDYDDYVGYLRHCPLSTGTADYLPYDVTSKGELVLYDYTMQVGDGYRHVDGYDDITVVARDSTELEGGSRRCRLTLSNGLVLIEGIGCINSPGLVLAYLNPSESMKGAYAYMEYGQDTGDRFSQKDPLLKYEGVPNGIASNRAVAEGAVWQYDVSGRRLSGAAHRGEKGVYIRNGRKVSGVLR